MGDHMPEWPRSDPAEPSPGAAAAFTGEKNSRTAPRGRYPVLWAAAGLVLIGGCAAAVAMHESGGQPRPQPVFCGLVECSVLHSEAAAASAPAGGPRAQPFLSPAAPAPTPVRTPEQAPATPAPSPAPVPAPTVTPTAAPAPGPTHRPGPLPGPTWTPPVPTWTPPAPAWPWPSRWAPPPRWPAGGEGWSRHSPWWEGRHYHQRHGW
jgi:hypothetical protein